MGYTITIGELGLALLVIGGIAVCVFLIILLRNLNESIKVLKDLLKTNRDNIDTTLKNMPVLTENLVEISNTAKDELKSIESTIHSVSETVGVTAAAANPGKGDLFGKIRGIIELIDTLRRIFFKEKDAGSVKKEESL